MALHRKQAARSSQDGPRVRAAHGHPTRPARPSGRHGASSASAPAQQRKLPGAAAAALVVVVVLVLLVAAHGLLSRTLFSSGGYTLAASGTEVSFTIEEGATTTEIAQVLGDAGLIESVHEFKARVKALGEESNLKPGTYSIVAGTAVDDIVERLAAGPDVDTVTIPEGYTLAQIASAVEDATGGSVTADDFADAAADASAYADDYEFLESAGSASLEGFLFPKTYDLEDGATADSLIRAMLDQYGAEIASLDFSSAEDAGLSSYEALILASIVEKESDENSRSEVASVFYNRLAQGMQLQSDATVAYVVGGDPDPDDLEVDSPYNTYLVDGLPAGPICSPGLESLQAVCDPDETDYLYFYFAADSDGDMVYYFSSTYDEHLAAIEEAEG